MVAEAPNKEANRLPDGNTMNLDFGRDRRRRIARMVIETIIQSTGIGSEKAEFRPRNSVS